MRLLGRNLLEAFIKKRPDCKSALRRWQKIIETSDYKNLLELKKTFPHADYVEGKTVFNVGGNNVGGNKVRTITLITYGISQIIITHVLTHEEYDKEKWKDE